MHSWRVSTGFDADPPPLDPDGPFSDDILVILPRDCDELTMLCLFFDSVNNAAVSSELP